MTGTGRRAGGARAGRSRLRLVLVLLLVACLGCTDSGAPAPAALVVAGGEASGVYARYGEGLAEVLARDLDGTRVTVATTSGSVDNVGRLARDDAQVAFALADTAADAVAGAGRFRGAPVALRAVARLYTNSVHVVVPAASRAQRVRDLRGLRVSVGGAGSGTELTATRMLAVAGLRGPTAPRVVRLGVQESAAALAAGDLDAFFWSGGLPTAGIAALVERTPVRLLPADDLLDAMRADHGEFFVAQTVPASVYGTAADVSTLGVPNLLLVRPDLPDALVREITAALFGGRERLVRAHPEARYLDQRSAVTTTPVPLHPGAAAYYRTVKPGVG